MPQKKWDRACKLCKGRSKLRCMICGHKAKTKQTQKDLSPFEAAALRGKRNAIQFLHDLDRGLTRAGNASTNDVLPEQQEEKKELVKAAADIDKQITEHRKWALELRNRYKVDGESLKSIADSEQLTVTMVIQIIKMVEAKLIRGTFKIEPNPPTPAYPPPPPPPIKLPIPRGRIVFEEDNLCDE